MQRIVQELSGIDEINVAEIEDGLTRNGAEEEAGVRKRTFPEMKAGLMTVMLLKWMLE